MNQKQIKEEEKIQILKERQILDNEINEYNKKIKEWQEMERQRLIDHQKELDYQISDKEMIKKREKQQELYERRMAELIEMEYQMKLNEQNEIHLKKLKELKEKGFLPQEDLDNNNLNYGQNNNMGYGNY